MNADPQRGPADGRGPLRVRVEVVSAVEMVPATAADAVRDALFAVTDRALGMDIREIDVCVVDVLGADRSRCGGGPFSGQWTCVAVLPRDGERRKRGRCRVAKDGKLNKGDEVSWRSHGRTVPGKVKKRITKRTEAAGRTVDASKDEPQYEVESDTSGRRAVHKPESLREKGEDA